jgi:S-adenosylmethionine hydrolase
MQVQSIPNKNVFYSKMDNVTSSPPIAIITDFGELDPYVGIMKGVIAQIAPGVPHVDITHKIHPGDIKRAAVHLWQAKPYFPAGTVFLIVVDPGVGTSRQGIIANDDKMTYIGPDNGVFTFVLDDLTGSWGLTNSKYRLPQVSATFHGRDIFAPAAAFAAKGVQGPEFGSPTEGLVQIPNPIILFDNNQLKGEILLEDQFGNLLTSLGRYKKIGQLKYSLSPWLANVSSIPEDHLIDTSSARMMLPGGKVLIWFDTFADIPAGACGVLVGSSGLLEIAANKENAAEILGLSEGDLVTLTF